MLTAKTAGMATGSTKRDLMCVKESQNKMPINIVIVKRKANFRQGFIAASNMRLNMVSQGRIDHWARQGSSV